MNLRAAQGSTIRIGAVGAILVGLVLVLSRAGSRPAPDGGEASGGKAPTDSLPPALATLNPSPKRFIPVEDPGGPDVVQLDSLTRNRISYVIEERFRSADVPTLNPFGDDLPLSLAVGPERCSSGPVGCGPSGAGEAYRLELGADSVAVIASDSAGAFRGLTTLRKLLASREALPLGSVVDWPDHELRALHFPSQTVSLDQARRIATRGREAQFNTLVVQVIGGVQLPSHPELVGRQFWTAEEFEKFVQFAASNGLTLVPHLDLLSHQRKRFAERHPELMFNERTYDPRNEEVYRIILPMVADVIRLAEPPAVHIGHDEIAGFRRMQKGGTVLDRPFRPLPAHLFLRDVRRLHRYLEKRGVETWMWGDMLLDPGDSPEPWQRHWHGNSRYAKLLEELPDDIVMCDWQYFSDRETFPSFDRLADAGHDVIGATWSDISVAARYSGYLAARPGHGRGMMVTTWRLAEHADSLAELTRSSGAMFWNAPGKGSDGDAGSDLSVGK